MPPPPDDRGRPTPRARPHRPPRATVTRDMLDWADTVLAMDQAVLGVLRTLRADEDSLKFHLYLGNADVPDPMGKDSDAFNDCAVLVEAGTALHLGHGPG
ncbi:hypothetical protein ABZ853_21820 [Streptomyces albidoflavus]